MYKIEINYLSKYKERIPNFIPDIVQQHIYLIELEHMNNENIESFVYRDFNDGVYTHRYFSNSLSKAQEFLDLLFNNPVFKYQIRYGVARGYQLLNTLIIQDTDLDTLIKTHPEKFKYF
jgi:hypothetical protein